MLKRIVLNEKVMIIFFKKYKIYLLIFFYVIFIVGFFYWGVFNLIKNIKNNSDEIQEKIIDNEMRQKNLSKIPEMEKTFKEVEENEKKLEGVLKKDGEVDFIKKIEVLAEETNNKVELKIDESAIDESGKKSMPKAKIDSKIKPVNENYISVRASLTGDYKSFLEFTKKLENFEYHVNITAISIDLVDKEPFVSSGNIFSNSNDLNNPNNQAVVKNDEKTMLKSQISFMVYVKK